MIRALVIFGAWVALAVAVGCALGAVIRHADRCSTKPVAPAVLSVVTVERDDNVTYLEWHTPAAPAMPVRLSPRPALTLANRIATSQAAVDLRSNAWLAGLLLAGAGCALYGGVA